MKNPIINHSWNSILDKGPLGKKCLGSKIEQLEAISETLKNQLGDDTERNLMAEGKIIYALKQALKYIDSPDFSEGEKDFYIYYEYASSKAKELEKVIDKELSELNL